MADLANPTSSTPTADVIVIGGGVMGCAIAFRLAQQHMKVIVVDRQGPGSEASSAAAGMISPQGEMVEFGPFFELCAASRDLYAGFVREIESLAGESVGYHEEGTMLVAPDEAAGRELEEVYRCQKRQGLPLEPLTREAVLDRVPGLAPAITGGLFLPGDHRVDNERLTPAVAQAASRLGVTFMTHTSVTRLNLTHGRLESIEARAESGSATSTLFADHFVLAAGCWSSELVAPLGMQLPTQPCRGQMLEFESPVELPLPVRAGHHYLVPRAPRRILAGTTAEYVGFEKNVTGEGLHSILEGVARFAPFIKRLRFRRAWAGLRPDTRDHAPILGRGEIDGLVFATGHFRNGILLAPVTAELIAELIVTGSTSRSIEAYRPTRFAAETARREAAR